MDETKRMDEENGDLGAAGSHEPNDGGAERSPLDPEERELHGPRFILSSAPSDTRSLSRRAIDFLRHNNPLYLLSVLFMFLGLFLASEIGEDNTALCTALSFYGVQVLYEIALLAMALFLAGRLIDRRHGLMLLLFLLLFACDVTFYQVRIASLASISGMAWVARLVGLFVLFFAAVKLALVHRLLGVTPRPDVIAFALGAVALISFAPQFIYDRIGASGAASMPFTGRWELYLIWLLAALITLPVIVRNFRESGFLGERPNPRAGDETRIQWLLTLVPALALPLQLHFNVNADALVANSQIGNLLYCFVPYLAGAIFLVGALCRGFVEENFGLATFDFLALCLLGCIVAVSQGGSSLLPTFTTTRDMVNAFGDVTFHPHRINLLIMLLAHAACAFVRGNRFCIALLSVVAIVHAGDAARTSIARTTDAVMQVSRTIWALLLITLSFLTLALGFASSVALKEKEGTR